MRSAIGIGLALSIISGVAHAVAPDITSFLFDVSGSASSSFTTGSSGAGSFGPTTGGSSNSALGTASYVDLSAETSVSAAGSLRSQIGGGISPTPGLDQTISAASSGTWTGRFVNILPTARSFSVDIGGLDDLSGGGFPGDYAAHLLVGATDYDLSPLYGSTETVGLGVLAPGQSVALTMTTSTSASFVFGPTSDGAGALIASIDLLSYDARPISPVPEPQTHALFMLGLAGLAVRRARSVRRPRPLLSETR